MWHLRTLLNLVAIVAIAQAAVKSLEIALDSRQKLAFQHAAEALTLKLIDLDPIRHYQRLREHRVQLRWLAAVVIFAWAAALFVSLQEVGFDFRAWWRSGTDFWSATYFLWVTIAFYLPFRVLLWWLGRSRNVRIMLIKAATLGVLVAGGVFADRYNLWILDTLPATLILSLSFYSAAVVALLYIAQAVVWLFRHIMWRIATDAKGAWSAALFVLAALLSLVAALVPRS
jgi:hypothetical protein